MLKFISPSFLFLQLHSKKNMGKYFQTCTLTLSSSSHNVFAINHIKCKSKSFQRCGSRINKKWHDKSKGLMNPTDDSSLDSW